MAGGSSPLLVLAVFDSLSFKIIGNYEFDFRRLKSMSSRGGGGVHLLGSSLNLKRCLSMFLSASFVKRILCFTKSNAFLKSINKEWTPFLPDFELSVASNQS